MEALIAAAIGVLVFSGVLLVLRRGTFEVILGLSLLSYAANLFVFSMGRLTIGGAPITADGQGHFADPLPQALVLTAIVIGFGMTAFLLVLAMRSYLTEGDDRVDVQERRDV